ncbi:ATP-binding protein, partial [Vibrio cholerae]
IQVAFTNQDQQLIESVKDNAEGVTEKDLANIFRPFYRVSTARDRHSGGTGLGLAITENAIRQHSGTISANRSHLGGLQVRFTLHL